MTPKKTLTLTITLTSLLLVFVLVMGVMQQVGLRHRQQVVEESEKVLFQYAIIREHLIESILAGQTGNLAGLAGEMESFRQNLTTLVAKTALPPEAQLSFLNQVDISGIILLLRETRGTGAADAEKLRQLQRETRILGERLLLLDRLVSGQAQRNLVGVQAVVIGLLALAVGGLLGALVLFYRRRDSEKSAARPVPPDIFRASQLSALGALAGEVAHEINDLSNGIINYAQLLSDELTACGERPEAEKMLGKIIGAGERIGAISGEILACSESRDQGKQLTDLNRVVADVLSLFKSRFRGQGILVNRDLPDNLPAIPGNRRQLRQLFINLLLNAQQALEKRTPGPEERKRLEIGTAVYKDGDSAWLRTIIVDYGCGMNPEILKQACNPDATGRNSGAGLGLPVCREIVREHNGRLFITSLAGDHTKVVVDLPIS
ncbi:MAG: hypothetical protein HGA96_14570 [Desulfobulbaceae bacterium]|nr:hypothetical protein [Desulfobulbaceae bacterium]